MLYSFFGWFPGIWILCADLSEHSLCSSFFLITPPMKMEQRECSETSVHKIQTPGNHSKESIQHSKHGENLKSRKNTSVSALTFNSLLITWCTNTLPKLYIPPTVYLCVLYLTRKKTATFVLYNINWLIFFSRDEKCLLRDTNWVFK
jgi:hypothetical protein